MAVIFGHNEGIARMKRETMTPNVHVAIDHNFYNEDPEKHISKASKASSGSFDDGEAHDKEVASYNREGRLKKAIGGAAKMRRHYPSAKVK